MGTRSLTIVYDSYCQKNGKMKHTPIINLYRQYDGYPSGHGAELALFLTRGKLVNGLTGDNTPAFNGMGCLAAQLVANFKDGPGQFYLYPTKTTDCGQDYEYHVYKDKYGELCVRVVNRGCNMFGLTMSDTNEDIFEGPVMQFIEFCKEPA